MCVGVGASLLLLLLLYADLAESLAMHFASLVTSLAGCDFASSTMMPMCDARGRRDRGSRRNTQTAIV
jgi:hypothetical protein